MAGIGAFSTEELLAWFNLSNTTPAAPKKNVVQVPPLGNAKHTLKLSLQAEIAKTQPEPRRIHEVEEEPLEAVPYQPSYNLKPDDEEAFDFVADFSPGKPINPKACPGDDDYFVDQSTEVYKDFTFKPDTITLPIHDHKTEILDTINANQVTVIQGATGSGKSTQVPQFILEQHAAIEKHCNIICTQPRRIAAKSVAKFVANCHGWSVGSSLVGYQIGMDKNVSDTTRLTFVTTGVLLEKLVNQRNMNQFTHVILDEVHERDKDTDFCLLVVRKLLRTNSPHVKVILMSATFEAAYFASYFSARLSDGLMVPPIIKVGGSPHPVHIFYLDDIRRIGECEPMNVENPRITKSCMQMVGKLLKDFDRIEGDDPMYGRGDFFRGTVLVFLPGLPEIMRMKDMLEDGLQLTKLILHSSISLEEQIKVFLPPEPGKRKVILATNIAESSITVPDIKYVIDFCLVKQMMCDWTTKYCCLETTWASQASLDQRKGRAGRVSHGRCYRLITSDFLNRLPEHSIPEMQRCPIESIILKCKKLNMGDPRATLRLALQAPRQADIEMAIINLKEVGALTVMLDGVFNKYDGNMTFIGKVLEGLPIDVKLGKLLILGHAFGCLESCLVIAAALSLKTFFVRPQMDELTGFRAKKSWDETSSSDCLAILNAYKVWAENKSKRRFAHIRNGEHQWCCRNYLHMGILNEVADLVRELSKRLANFNIKPTRSYTSHDVDPSLDTLCLKVVLCGAFYPNYFRWGELDEEMCMKLLSGHNPSTTVMLHGLPDNPTRYADQLSSIFSHCGPGKKIYFEAHKAFIEFEQTVASRSSPISISNPVLDSVYMSLQMRNARHKPSLTLVEETTSRLVYNEVPTSAPLDDEDTIPPMKLPDSGIHQIFITNVIDASHFWAQLSSLNMSMKIQEVNRSIASRPLTPLIMDPHKMKGVYCLARFSVDGRFYRAKIIDINPKEKWAQVMFIDYGNTEFVLFDGLCEMASVDRKEPAMAFECYLSGIKPPLMKWTEKACIRFNELTMDKHLQADIYSKVEGVLRVELYDTTSRDDILINDVLVAEEHAVSCIEPYASRVQRAHALTTGNSNSSLLRTSWAAGPESCQIHGGGNLGISCTAVDWHQSRRHKQDSRSGQKLSLKGPSSPYEVSFHAMAESGSFRSVRIQQGSINSIVVNNEPQDKNQRLMVAAQVILNPAGSTCIARDTTLLPAIPGLIHLMCLIFAPRVEMRCDELKRQYTGAICGLGSNPSTFESLYPEHDMEITFDTLFTQEDLNQVNRIRTAINLTLESEDALARWGEQAIKKIQKSVREIVTKLILKSRISVPVYSCGKNDWNQVSPDDVLYVEEEEDPGDSVQPYPLHSGILISGERIDLQRPTKVLLMRKSIRELYKKISSGLVEPGPIECPLCRTTCSSAFEMRQHFKSKSHRMKEDDLFSDELPKDLSEKMKI